MRTQSNEVAQENVLSLVPFLRLEDDYPEETEILDIQADIDDARGTGDPIEALIRKRQQIIESWIQRVENKLTNAYSKEKEKLERELDRAKLYKRDILSRLH